MKRFLTTVPVTRRCAKAQPSRSRDVTGGENLQSSSRRRRRPYRRRAALVAPPIESIGIGVLTLR